MVLLVVKSWLCTVCDRRITLSDIIGHALLFCVHDGIECPMLYEGERSI